MTEACSEYKSNPDDNKVLDTVKPFKYTPLCPACAEHSTLVFYGSCEGCKERSRIVAKQQKGL